MNCDSTTIISSESVKTSAGVLQFAATLTTIHRVFWKKWVWTQVYGNHNNWLALGLGHLIYSKLGNSTITQAIAMSIFYAYQLLNYFQQQDVFVESCRRFLESVQCRRPICVEPSREPAQKKHFLWNDRQINHLVCRMKSVNIRIMRILASIWDVILNGFKLTMRIMDVAELITLDPSKLQKIATKSIKEGGVYIPHVLKELSKNKEAFLSRLEQEEKTINKFLQNNGMAKFKGKEITNIARTIFVEMETVLKGYELISDTVGTAIKDGLLHIIYHFIPGDNSRAWFKENVYDPDLPNFWKRKERFKQVPMFLKEPAVEHRKSPNIRNTRRLTIDQPQALTQSLRTNSYKWTITTSKTA